MEKPNILTWGAWVQRRLKFLGLTQRALAKKLGVNQDTVSRWAQFLDMPPVRKGARSKLAGALQIAPSELPYAHLFYDADTEGFIMPSEAMKQARCGSIAALSPEERLRHFPATALTDEQLFYEIAKRYRHALVDLRKHWLSVRDQRWKEATVSLLNSPPESPPPDPRPVDLVDLVISSIRREEARFRPKWLANLNHDVMPGSDLPLDECDLEKLREDVEKWHRDDPWHLAWNELWRLRGALERGEISRAAYLQSRDALARNLNRR